MSTWGGGRWLLVIVLLVVMLPLGLADAAPVMPTPVVVPGQPGEAETTVVTFRALHISVDGVLRYMDASDLWLVDMNAGALRHTSIGQRGYIRMAVPIETPVYWALYPRVEFGDAGGCHSLRNAELMTFTVAITERVAVFYGEMPCDGLGVE